MESPNAIATRSVLCHSNWIELPKSSGTSDRVEHAFRRSQIFRMESPAAQVLLPICTSSHVPIVIIQRRTTSLHPLKNVRNLTLDLPGVECPSVKRLRIAICSFQQS